MVKRPIDSPIQLVKLSVCAPRVPIARQRRQGKGATEGSDRGNYAGQVGSRTGAQNPQRSGQKMKTTSKRETLTRTVGS